MDGKPHEIRVFENGGFAVGWEKVTTEGGKVYNLARDISLVFCGYCIENQGVFVDG